MASRTGTGSRLDKAGRLLGMVAFPWAMLMYSKSILTPVGHSFSPQALRSEVHLGALAVLMAFFFTLSATLAGRWKEFVRFSVALGPVWLLLFWAGASLLWSADPVATAWGLLGLASTTGFGIMFSFYYSVEEQLPILALYMFAGAFVSLVLIWLFPSQGISSGVHAGAWEGVFVHKNVLGIHAAFGVVLFLLCGTGGTRCRWVYWGGFVACLALLAGSRSLTGAASALAGSTAYGAVVSLRNPPWGLKRGYVAIAWIIGAAICCAWAIGHLDAVLQQLGRDRTLTNRTELWSVVLDKGAARPWLGYGFNAFWTGKAGVSGEVEQALRFYPWHAHNGMVDLFLALGLIGTALFLICLFRAVIPASREAIGNHRAQDSWHILFLVFLITCNLTESQLVKHNSVFWMLFVTATCNLFGRSHHHRSSRWRAVGAGDTNRRFIAGSGNESPLR